MDAVPLFTGIKIKDRESCGYKIKVVDLGFDSHIDARIDSSITIRAGTSCTDILEGYGLSKARASLFCALCSDNKSCSHHFCWGGGTRELPVTRVSW